MAGALGVKIGVGRGWVGRGRVIGLVGCSGLLVLFWVGDGWDVGVGEVLAELATCLVTGTSVIDF